jgi:hypothetical protein
MLNRRKSKYITVKAIIGFDKVLNNPIFAAFRFIGANI